MEAGNGECPGEEGGRRGGGHHGGSVQGARVDVSLLAKEAA